VPFTDGVKSLSVVTDLKKHTNQKETTDFEKTSLYLSLMKLGKALT
jgi:hypothetical protein